MISRIVPLDIIFSKEVVPPSGFKHENPNNSVADRWSDIPIVNLEPHMSAARSVLKKEGSLQAYWAWFNKFYPEVAQRYAEQYSLWERAVVEKLSSYARNFFVPFPTVAKLEKDRLILQDGNMRCCVAKVRNKSWIRVNMPEDIVFKWDQRPIEPLKKVIINQKRKAFYTPVMHSDYRRWRVNREGRDRLDLIRSFLGPTHKKLSVLDIGCNTGYYSFHLSRQGFNVVGLDYDSKHLDVAKALKEMYSLEVDFRLGEFQTFPRFRRYDLVLGMTVFWHILGWGDFPYAAIGEKELGEQLDALVGHALIWESGVRADDEIEVIRSHSGLKHYTHLADTEGTGVSRKFGVFTRVPFPEVKKILQNE